MSPTRKRTPPARRRRKSPLAAAPLLLLACVLCFFIYQNYSLSSSEPGVDSPGKNVNNPAQSSKPPGQTTGNPDAETPPEDTPGEVIDPNPHLPDFEPYYIESTNPSNFLRDMGVMVDGAIVESYSAEEVIDFGYGENYTEVEGVIAFRGNNFRNSASYGVANISQALFGEQKWNISTGSLSDASGDYWSGNGWTGQPLIVKWPKETRAEMTNMYDWAREKDELIEVIYPSMDGNIYFIELSSGSKTRNDVFIGYTFKGAGALDPRGYPILYVGSGLNSTRGSSRAFVISLLDGSVMYEFGINDGFALRPWHMFDSSPLVDAQTDQLIYPGENGVLYIIKLNTVYDAAAGTVSVNPSRTVKWRYNTKRAYWLGMEDSAVIWRGHMIIADNGGNLICLDLNTLEVTWVQDILDDSNSTPALELEDGHPYVYVSTSFHAGWRANEGSTAKIPIWKIDAVTGEIVWQYDFSCHSVSGISGGVQASPAVGKNKLENLIFYPVARTPNAGTGVIVALDKRTGEKVWEQQTQVYSWSSPVDVYDAEGNGYLIFCTSSGHMYLMDGLTGKILDNVNLGSNIEASPAVYGSTVVVGTRASGIWGVTIK